MMRDEISEPAEVVERNTEPALGRLSGLFIHNHPLSVMHREDRNISRSQLCCCCETHNARAHALRAPKHEGRYLSQGRRRLWLLTLERLERQPQRLWKY